MHKWVCIRVGCTVTRFRADSCYKGRSRHDCVKLVRQHNDSEGRTYAYAQIMWIVTGINNTSVAIVVPLFFADDISPLSSAQKVVTQTFPTLRRHEGSLAVIYTSQMLTRVQAQFVVSKQNHIVLLNTFADSNITNSGGLQVNSVVSEVLKDNENASDSSFESS